MATERVGIEIEIMGYEEALNQMRNLERSMKGLSGMKVRWQTEKDLQRLQKQLVALRSEYERLRAEQAKVGKGTAEWQHYANTMGEVRRQMAQTTAEAQRLKQALRNTSSVGQIFKRNTSHIAHLGSALQSAGNAMQRFLAPWRLLMGGALLGAGYGAINKISEGLTSGFSRYDTMKKYPQMMAEYSKASYTAQQSIDELDHAVRGFPTGLDEIVQMAQRYTLSLGDMKKGTQLAIASNNAFLASMATDSQKYQGMLQLQDLMNGKKLTSREWMSLGTSMGKAINEIGKEMGYTNDEMGEFRQKLYSGQIATEDFLNALIKVGTGTGKVAKLAELSKQTWEAFSKNIGNAFSRMTYGVLTSLDEITKAATGKTVNQLLTDTVIPGIDKMTESVKGWIKAHPEEITEFFDALKSIDWKGLGKGFIQGLGDIAGFIQKMAESLDGKSLEKVGKFFSQLMWLAPMLTIGGGLLKGTRHIGGGVLTGIQLLIESLVGLNIAKASGKLGKLGEFLGKFGKVSKTAEKIGGVGKGAGKIGLKGFGYAAGFIGAIGLLVTEIVGFAYVDTKLAGKAIDNLIGITGGIKTIFDNVKGLKAGLPKGTGKNIKQAVSDIMTIYSILGGKGQNADKRGVSSDNGQLGLNVMNANSLQNMANSMKSMSSIFKTLGQIGTDISTASQSLTTITQGKGGTSMIAQLKQTLTGKNGIFSMLQEMNLMASQKLGDTSAFADKMGGLKKAMSRLKAAIGSLAEMGSGDLAKVDGGAAFTAIENVKTLISRLGQALNTEGLASLQEQVNIFRTAIQGVFEALNSDFANVKVTIKIKGKVIGADATVALVKAADRKIRSAVRGIKTSYSKTVKISITPSVITGGLGAVGRAVRGIRPHTGGYVAPDKLLYRRKGGSVGAFKPKGTDTVPAMLTPGEYVHKKKAVDYFGVKFMQKINNLDVRGAMRELSAKAGSIANSARGTTITNNITNNNNQKVNQKIYTNNPNFAFKRANRYIAAL